MPDTEPLQPMRPYPAPSRPEQPMRRSDSPWPWVTGFIVLAVVGIVVPIAVFLIHLVWTYEG